MTQWYTEQDLIAQFKLKPAGLEKKLENHLSELGDTAARDAQNNFLLKEPGEPYLVNELLTRQGNQYHIADQYLATLGKKLK